MRRSVYCSHCNTNRDFKRDGERYRCRTCFNVIPIDRIKEFFHQPSKYQKNILDRIKAAFPAANQRKIDENIIVNWIWEGESYHVILPRDARLSPFNFQIHQIQLGTSKKLSRKEFLELLDK